LEAADRKKNVHVFFSARFTSRPEAFEPEGRESRQFLDFRGSGVHFFSPFEAWEWTPDPRNQGTASTPDPRASGREVKRAGSEDVQTLFLKCSESCGPHCGSNRPTQSIMYVPLQVNKFWKIIFVIVQYKYLKSSSEDFMLRYMILRTTWIVRYCFYLSTLLSF